MGKICVIIENLNYYKILKSDHDCPSNNSLDWNSEAQRNNFWLLLIKDVQHA